MYQPRIGPGPPIAKALYSVVIAISDIKVVLACEVILVDGIGHVNSCGAVEFVRARAETAVRKDTLGLGVCETVVEVHQAAAGRI